MPRRPMSQKAYLRAGGGVCPACRSHEIEGAATEIDGNSATQEVTCNTCHSEWLDYYKLDGYTLLEPGAEEDAPEKDEEGQ